MEDTSRFPKHYIIEACVEDLEGSLRADTGGATQIELCSDLHLDGLTPEQGLVESVMASVTIPVKIMIRSRAGNFQYVLEEIIKMADQIRSFRHLPIHAFVIGALDDQGLPDRAALSNWVEAAGEVPLCFHKAIDQSSDWKKALSILSEYDNITSILTSGLAPTAVEGLPVLREMVQLFGDRFQIIAAGSVTRQIVFTMSDRWPGTAFHGRRILELDH